MSSFRENIFTFYYLVLGRQKLARKKRRKLAKQQFEATLETIPENVIAFDCGANRGYFTARFLDKGCRVHAFEPEPVAAEILNEKLKDHPKLTFNPVAVGAKPGRAKLFRADDFDDAPEHRTVSSSLLSRKSGDQQNFVEVEVIDLLDYIEKIPERIAIMKMDIEGAEVDILEALIETGVHEKIDLIFVETHERISFDCALRTSRLRAKVRVNNLTNFNLDHN